jgi:ABC-type phosphate/phosphonate transport system substrate-binding protein
MLRCATWLAPGLPLGLFEAISNGVASALGTDATLVSYTTSSGPSPDDDPFARDEVDLGFMCAPSFRQLTATTPSSVRLVRAAPVFDDDRNGDRPVYFAELVVRDGVPATTIADLAGRRIGFNDHQSLSGLTALLDRLRALGFDETFATLVPTGGHRESLQQLADGTIDAASIDSNTLRAVDGLPNGLRIVETWGPFPVQPVVIRATLADKMQTVITTALLTMHEDPAGATKLRAHHVRRFAPVTEEDYR